MHICISEKQPEYESPISQARDQAAEIDAEYTAQDHDCQTSKQQHHIYREKYFENGIAAETGFQLTADVFVRIHSIIPFQKTNIIKCSIICILLQKKIIRRQTLISNNRILKDITLILLYEIPAIYSIALCTICNLICISLNHMLVLPAAADVFLNCRFYF